MTNKLKQALVMAALAAGATATDAAQACDTCGNLPNPTIPTGGATNIDNQVKPIITVAPNTTNTVGVTGSNTGTFTNAPVVNAAGGTAALNVGAGALSPSATADQKQNQTQGQTQGQTLSNANSNRTDVSSTVVATTGASSSKVEAGAVQNQNVYSSSTTYKAAAASAIAPAVVAGAVTGCNQLKGGVSGGAQWLGGGVSLGYNGGSEYNKDSKECAVDQAATLNLASPNAAQQRIGIEYFKTQSPAYKEAVAGAVAGIVANDELQTALGGGFNRAAAVAAPAPVVTIVDAPAAAPALNKNPCADKPGTVPVWSAKLSAFECRPGAYYIK